MVKEKKIYIRHDVPTSKKFLWVVLGIILILLLFMMAACAVSCGITAIRLTEELEEDGFFDEDEFANLELSSEYASSSIPV